MPSRRICHRATGVAAALGAVLVAAAVPVGSEQFPMPATEPDLMTGKDINGVCAGCHGKDGWGDREKAVPQLAGQYTEYLLRQVPKFVAKARVHDEDAPDEELLAELTPEEIRDVLAYLSTVDD